MAVNPNFTNANANTPFVTSGSGGSNFPNGIIFGGTGGPALLTTADVNGFQGAVLGAGSNLLQLETFIPTAVECLDNNTQTDCLRLAPIGITYIRSAQGSIQPLMLPNLAAFSTGILNNQLTFALQGLSSFQSGAFTANANALMSSLKSTFPSNFS